MITIAYSQIRGSIIFPFPLGLVVMVLGLVSVSAKSDYSTCEEILGVNELYEQIQALSESETEYAQRLDVLKLYSTKIKTGSALAKYFPPKKVQSELAVPENEIYVETLRIILENLPNTRVPIETHSSRSRFYLRKALKIALAGRVPPDTIETRIRDLEESAGTDHHDKAMKRALGDLELVEVQEMMHGGDPLHPTPESWLGQYLQASGAASLIRTFSIDPKINNGQEQGPEKLVVAVSQASFPFFKQFLFRRELVMHIGHGDMIQSGTYYKFSAEKSEMRVPNQENTILPGVLLKSSEAQRLQQYFVAVIRVQGAGKWNWAHVLKQPWLLKGYSGTGGYICCTHWIGNIPLGDKKVERYSFPQQWGQNAVNGPPPVVQDLKPYDTTGLDPSVMRVWKVPGHQQYSEVLGVLESNNRGEFAHPGWVIQTIIGKVLLDRNPIVFVAKPDHQAPIDPKFMPVYENPY